MIDNSFQPKTDGQRKYIHSIINNTITFATGPAGTGKTIIAVKLAVDALKSGEVNKLILCRPAVAAGEKLGFLPGDMAAKVDPYLRPIYDYLEEFLGEDYRTYVTRKYIEVAPIAFMRGRAQPMNSLISTKNGFVKMGSLSVGDKIISSTGRDQIVTGIFPQGKKDVYKITFSDNTSCLSTEDHLWNVKTREDFSRSKDFRTITLKEIIDAGVWQNKQRRFEIPILSGPAHFNKNELEIDPYVLGIILGDGCISGNAISITNNDKEIFDNISLRLNEDFIISEQNPGPKKTKTFNVIKSNHNNSFKNDIKSKLECLGLMGLKSYEKFIPEKYIYSDVSDRLDILRGLMDSDGSIYRDKKFNRVEYSSTSERLADGVIKIVESLGGICFKRIRTKENKKGGIANGRHVIHRRDSWTVDIKLPGSINPFLLKRKSDMFEKMGTSTPRRFISNVELVGSEECQCISVSSNDKLYLTDNFIVTHNTLKKAFILMDEAQNSTVEQMKMFLTRLGDGSRMVINGDMTQNDLKEDQRSGLEHASGILRGISGLGWVDLKSCDVVRHPMVTKIVEAYDERDKPR